MVSAGADAKAYMPVKLVTSRKAHNKVIAVGLEATNAVLSFPLRTDPMLSLVTTLAIFKAMLDSASMVLKDKEQVVEVGDCLLN